MAGGFSASVDPGSTYPPPGTADPTSQGATLANDPAYMAMVGGLGQAPSPYADEQAQFGKELRDPNSPESQEYGALSKVRNAALMDKQNAIQRAMNILSATRGDQSTNLPLLAAGAAMLQPGYGGLSGSLGRGFAAAVPVVEQQRQREMDLAKTQGALGVEAAGIPAEASEADIQDFFHRMTLAEQAQSSAAITGTRLGAAQTSAQGRVISAGVTGQSREDAANINAKAAADRAQIASDGRVTAAQIAADKGAWSYQGTDPDDPKVGYYYNKNTNSLNPGPAINVKGNTDTALIKNAKAFVQAGTAPDMATALAMARAGVNDAAVFAARVQARAHDMATASPEWATKPYNELLNAARESVTDDYVKGRARGTAAGAPPVPTAPATPPAAPAPPARPAPATASPAAIPPPPAGIPPGAQYSPSLKNWWWQDAATKQWQHN